MPWNYRRFGTLAQPIHKSDLNEITGPDYGCPRRFRYAMDEMADSGGQREQIATSVHCKTAAGTAVHETLARALSNADVLERLLHGDRNPPSLERIRATFEHEFRAACDGRAIDWGRENPQELIGERVVMIDGALRDVAERVDSIELIEAGFIVDLDGVWQAGHVDLVYRPRAAPDELGLLDWKTGSQKPDPIELEHGWEAGIYSLALARGTFIPRSFVGLEPVAQGGWRARCHTHELVRPSRWQAERDALEAALNSVAAGELIIGARRLEQFPTHIHLVHMQDYVPYKKAGKRELKRAEDVDYYGMPAGSTLRFEAGDRRGPAWLPIARRENDIPRLAYRLRQVVGTVRMGRFLDLVGERCRRCPYSRDCLTGGYAPRGDELAELERTLKEAGL